MRSTDAPSGNARRNGSERTPWHRRRWLIAFGVVAAVAVAFETWSTIGDHALESEIRRLPKDERRELFERSMLTLRTSCEHPTGPRFEDFCERQADFVRAFPECDAECTDYLDKDFGAAPTR